MSLLNDNEYLAFLTEGYLVLQPSDMNDGDHDDLYRAGQALYDKAAASDSETPHLDILGDHLLEEIPKISRMLEDPVVTGAITSILGEGYALHPHNFLHESTTKDQPFHQDGNLPWNERGHYRSHRPDWLILFYYPQMVDQTNGPTEVVAGTQYWTKDFEKSDGTWHSMDALDRTFFREVLDSDDIALRDRRQQEAVNSMEIPDLERRFIHVPKGAVVIGNYDLVHRGSRKLPQTPQRLMYKFYFARTREPVAPSWNNQGDPDITGVRPELQPVVRQIWNWSAGKSSESDNADDSAGHLLQNGGEHEKVAAAYKLGMQDDDPAISCLIAGITNPAESTRRAAAYGLRCQGKKATTKVVEVLTNGSAPQRRVAAYALGTVETAESEAAVSALVTSLASDSDDLVRSNAAYSLAQISRAASCDAAMIGTGLIKRLAPGAEPNNTNAAGLPRSTVRQSAAYGLMLLALNHQLDETVMSEIRQFSKSDPDRYVRGMLAEAVR